MKWLPGNFELEYDISHLSKMSWLKLMEGRSDGVCKMANDRYLSA